MTDFDYINSREVRLSGIVSVPKDMSVDTFTDLFIEWIEDNDFAFGGSTGPYEYKDDDELDGD